MRYIKTLSYAKHKLREILTLNLDITTFVQYNRKYITFNKNKSNKVIMM